jgi:hypothetical protein
LTPREVSISLAESECGEVNVSRVRLPIIAGLAIDPVAAGEAKIVGMKIFISAPFGMTVNKQQVPAVHVKASILAARGGALGHVPLVEHGP